MKKLLVIAIVLVAAVLMAVTKPDRKAHKAAMMEAVKEYVKEEADSRFGRNPLSMFGSQLVIGSVKTVLNSKLRMHDYVVANSTYVRIDGEEQLLSVGLLGHVFTFDKEMLREHLEEALNGGKAEDGDEEEEE